MDTSESGPFTEGNFPCVHRTKSALTLTQEVKLDLKPILSAADIPMAVHGTNRTAWESIGLSWLRSFGENTTHWDCSDAAVRGLSKRTRNHIHLAQGVPEGGVISGWS